MIIFCIFILGSIVISYFYLTRNYGYWRDRNIPYAKNTIPGFGHTWPLFLIRVHLVDLIKQICDGFASQSMVGFYYQTTPALVIREPELIETVLQTNFASFSKNLWKVNYHLDRLQVVNPFFTHGNTWLTSRKHISSAFSTKNLKIFFNSIENVCGNLEHFLNDKLRKNNNIIELNLHNLAYKYTRAVASFATFSEKNLCLKNKPVTSVIDKILQRNFFDLVNQTLHFYFYEIKKIFRVRFIPKEIDRLMANIIKETKQIRQQEKSAHKFDFLQLMLNMQETKAINDDIMAVYVFTFYFNLNDTSSMSLSFACYQIARHLHVQQKLRDEINNVLAKYDGRLTFDALKEMTYLEQVLKESHRLYPSVGCLSKICTEEFELEGSDGLRCRVDPGTKIFVNVYELHRNPKYWPNPDNFDPDRFAYDKKIEKYTFLPFSEGPRICIGMRLAVMLSKAYLATIVKNYILELSPKTPKEPLEFLPGSFLTLPKNKLWVHLKSL